MNKLTIHADGLEGFRKRSLERARKLDRGEPLEPAKIITLDKDFPSLTPSRLRLFRKIKEREISITALAEVLGRPREAVSRDVTVLRSCGLVKVREVPNPGHGRASRVSAVARKVLLEL